MDRCKPGWAEEGGRTAGRLVGAELEAAHCAHAAVLVVPLGQQLVERKIGELKQVIGERLGHSIGDGFRFTVGTAERFRNHVIHDAQVYEILGGHLQGRGGIRHFGGIIPQDRGTAFRRNHGIDAMLEHQDAIYTPSASAPPLPPSPMTIEMIGTVSRACTQISRDGFRLPALFGPDTGIGAGGVDERDDRSAEFFRHLHEAEGLPIPFRIGHPEVPLHAFLEGLPF